MADLFQRDRTVVVRHIRNIYKTGELLPDSTCAKIAQVAKDGKKRQQHQKRNPMLTYLSGSIWVSPASVCFRQTPVNTANLVGAM